MLYIAYCPNCDHTQAYGTRTDGFGTSKHIPMKKFCTQCGTEMIGKCLGCGAYREHEYDKHCPNCGKAYK